MTNDDVDTLATALYVRTDDLLRQFPELAPWRPRIGLQLFRYLPGQPGYNRRLRAAAGLITTLTRMLAADTSLWTDDVWVVDSTPGGMRPVPGNGQAF